MPRAARSTAPLPASAGNVLVTASSQLDPRGDADLGELQHRLLDRRHDADGAEPTTSATTTSPAARATTDLRPARQRHDPGRRLDHASQRPLRGRCATGLLTLSDATLGLVGACRDADGLLYLRASVEAVDRRRRLHRGRRRQRRDLRQPRPGRHHRRQLEPRSASTIAARSGPTAPT